MQVTTDFATNLVERALRKGATACEVIVREENEFSVQVRLGEIETLKESSAKGLGLRVLYEGRQASVATSDFETAANGSLLDEAIALAKATSVDETAGLPDQADLAQRIPDLQLYDPVVSELPTDTKIDLAIRAERTAQEFDPAITNSEGGSFESSAARMILANSLGFAGEYRGTTCSLITVPVATQDGQMQRDAWFDSKRFFAKLESPESIGRQAAERTLRKLGARKVKTQEAPVVFDSMTAREFLGYIFSAISGDAIFRKSSFLVGKLDEKIAASALTIIDDGQVLSGPGSRPFDAEGLPTRRTIVVENGVLRNYLLNTYTAKKLNLRSTGNAVRGLTRATAVGPNNFYVKPGDDNPEAIIKSVKSGLFLTDLFGFGVNTVNGDFSLGASGLWIEDGNLGFPVEEVTVASNLKDMLLNIEAVGSDLEFRGVVGQDRDFRGRMASPTLKVSRMIISGD